MRQVHVKDLGQEQGGCVPETGRASQEQRDDSKGKRRSE